MRKPPSADPRLREHVTRGLPDNLLRFSFQLMRSTRKFGHERTRDASAYLDHLLRRLQSMSCMHVAEFRSNKDLALRAHRHHWNATTEPHGFPLLGPEWDGHEAWQFQLSANKHGRVHGILVDEVFYVVWLDPEHRLYQ